MSYKLTQDVEDVFQEAMDAGGQVLTHALRRLDLGDKPAEVLADYASQRKELAHQLFLRLANVQADELDRQADQRREFAEAVAGAVTFNAKVASGDIPTC